MHQGLLAGSRLGPTPAVKRACRFSLYTYDDDGTYGRLAALGTVSGCRSVRGDNPSRPAERPVTTYMAA